MCDDCSAINLTNIDPSTSSCVVIIVVVVVIIVVVVIVVGVCCDVLLSVVMCCCGAGVIEKSSLMSEQYRKDVSIKFTELSHDVRNLIMFSLRVVALLSDLCLTFAVV